MRFRREEIESFHATDYDIDPRTGTVRLRYAFSGGRDGTGGSGRSFFEERIDLGGPVHLDSAQYEQFEHLVRLLHAVAGTSYYKAAAPNTVSIESGPLDACELRFVRDVYDKGLREFAHKNGLPIPLRVDLKARDLLGDARRGSAGGPPPGIAIPLGGGKDSAVVIESIRDLEPVLVAVNPAPAARRVAQAANLHLVPLNRTIDPALLELNEAGALNGHVPITALISLIAVAAGYVHGYSTTVMALEGSADEPTRLIGQAEINHQWSKSTECELELASVLHGVSPWLRYGSALRNLSEIEISGCFAGLRRYHGAFRSCNRAFALSGAVDGWCNDCPKCRFVYVMLATALGRDEMVGIFGTDLLGDPAQVDGFRDLLEVDRKPFECVGTRHESIEAFSELASSAPWSDAPVVEALRRSLHSRSLQARRPARIVNEASRRRGPSDSAGVVSNRPMASALPQRTDPGRGRGRTPSGRPDRCGRRESTASRGRRVGIWGTGREGRPSRVLALEHGAL